MEAITNLFAQTVLKVLTSFAHNWPFLVISIVISVLLKLYLDSDKVAQFLMRHQRAGVVGATAVAVTTPLCSCGTTAVILGMMASLLPWAPIVAFMVASPLTSPEELVYSAGLFGWSFASAFFISSILLGLLGGLAAGIMEKRGWLADQARMSGKMSDANKNPPSPYPLPAVAREKRISPYPLPEGAREKTLSVEAREKTQTEETREKSRAVRQWEFATVGGLTLQPGDENAMPGAESDAGERNSGGCGCGASAGANPAAEPAAGSCGCSKESAPVSAQSCACANRAVTEAHVQSYACAKSPAAGQAKNEPRVTLRMFWDELFSTGKRLLIMFAGFAFIGYLLNGLVPAAWVAAVFGSGNAYSIPIAATLGLPLYINTEGSLPLVRAMIDGGMSQGAALAFLITGAGTSIGAIAGALTIARWRVIGLVVGTLWVGAVLVGYIFNFLLAARLF